MYAASVVDRLVDDLRSAIGDLDKLQKESAEFYLCLSNIGELCSSDIASNNELDLALHKLEHDTDISMVCQNAYEGVAHLLKRQIYWHTETLRLRQVLVDIFGMDLEQVNASDE